MKPCLVFTMFEASYHLSGMNNSAFSKQSLPVRSVRMIGNLRSKLSLTSENRISWCNDSSVSKNGPPTYSCTLLWRLPVASRWPCRVQSKSFVHYAIEIRQALQNPVIQAVNGSQLSIWLLNFRRITCKSEEQYDHRGRDRVTVPINTSSSVEIL